MFKSVEKILLTLIIIQSVILIIFLPNLENPDVAYHFETTFHGEGGQESIYKNILHLISNVIVNDMGINQYTTYLDSNEDFGYFNWSTIYIYESYNSLNVMLLQFVNIFFLIVSIVFFVLFLKLDSSLKFTEKRMFTRLCLLFYLYPAVGYLIVGITPDLFTYLYQPFFILLIYKRSHFKNFFLCILIFLFIDEGIILNIYFLFIYIFLEFIYKKKIIKNKYLYVMVGLLIIPVIYLGTTQILMRFFNNRIFEILIYVQENHGVLYTKLINVFLGALYFGGSGSFITFPLFYAFFGILILVIFIKTFFTDNVQKDYLIPILLSNIVAVGSSILLFPSYSHIRYYLYTIFIILMCFFTVLLKDKFLQSDKKVLLIGILFFSHNILLTLAIAAYVWN